MAKTAVSHSGSEAQGPAQARGPGQGPTSPMPRAGSDCIVLYLLCCVGIEVREEKKRNPDTEEKMVEVHCLSDI